MATYHGASSGLVFRTNFAATNPITIASGAVITSEVLAAPAIYGASYPWTFANYGAVTGTVFGFGAGAGISLAAGGLVLDGRSGAAAPQISGDGKAIYVTGGLGTVINFGLVDNADGILGGTAVSLKSGGTVTNNGTIAGASVGISMQKLGSVVNGPNGGTAALINGGQTGIYLTGGVGTVTNYGTVSSTTNYGNETPSYGVEMRSGGAVTNGRAGNSGGAITGGHDGIYVTGGSGTVTNFGAISSTAFTYNIIGAGIYFDDGGDVITGADNSTTALISGVRYGIKIANAMGVVDNYGTITTSCTEIGYPIYGVLLGNGGAIVNGGINAPGAVIKSSGFGVGITKTIGSVSNDGTIISARESGIYLQRGGNVTNGAAGAALASISGDIDGISVNGAYGVLINIGTVSGAVGSGFFSNYGGTIVNGITNTSGALISGETGVYLERRAGTVTNYATITGTTGSRSAGVFLGNGGSVTNGSPRVSAAALITGYNDGVNGSGSTVDNFAQIKGETGYGVVAGVISNSGTIRGAAGASGTNITNSGLIVADGSPFISFLSQRSPGSGVVSATVTNTGTIMATETGGIGVETSDIVNSGMIASTGTSGIGVVLFGGVPGTVVNYGTISGTGGTAIDLTDNGDVVIMGPNSVLSGAIANFTQTDTIDIAGVIGTSTNYASGKLSLLNAVGNLVTSFLLSGSFESKLFAATPDGSGGTDITLVSAAGPSNDFNGDGMSDVLWQNDNAQDSGTGQTAIWLMDGVTPTAEDIITTVPTSWHVVATGDFYGTGDAAILWQNDNGQAGLWEMNGTNPTAETVFASPPPSWHMIATGDFNGDGMSDVLWQYEDTGNSSDSQNGNVAIWEMNGASAIAAAVVAQPGPDWDVIGTGDFNGDGKSDILWQYEDTANSSDPQNGNVAIWEMNGLSPIAEAVIAQPGPDWHVVGTGDFNGDGKADILWQYEDGQNASDPQNGNVAIWLMNGTTPTAEAVVAQPGSAWHAIGTGDYDGSGRSGILWQNTNGQAAIWLMNGLTPTTESVFASPPSSWHVIAA